MGNGRLGAMVLGGVENEHIQLNEDTLWAGGPHDPNNPEALTTLPESAPPDIRRQIWRCNRLIGDEYFPAEDEYTALGAIVKLPEWFVKDLPRPGPRIAFSTWRHYTKNDPLPESGLIGPVKSFTAVQRTVE